MKKNLFTRLTLPLIAVVVVSLFLGTVLSHQIEFGSFFINLGTEIMGILVTILYVDWILRRNSEAEWKTAKKLCDREIYKYCQLVLDGILDILEITLFERANIITILNLPIEEQMALLRSRYQLAQEEVGKKVKALSDEEWTKLFTVLHSSLGLIDGILQRYANVMTSETAQKLLEVRDKIDELGSILLIRVAGSLPLDLNVITSPSQQNLTFARSASFHARGALGDRLQQIYSDLMMLRETYAIDLEWVPKTPYHRNPSGKDF